MTTSRRQPYCTALGFLLCLGVLMFVASMAGVASAAEKPAASLSLVSEDAAFYSASLHYREQWNAIAHSHAWAKLKAMPIVQMGLGLYAMQAADPDSVPGKIEAAFRDPAFKDPIALGKDMISNEVFVYGGPACADALELGQKLIAAMRYGPLVAQLSDPGATSSPRLQEALVVSTLSENRALIKVPEMILGFKVKNATLAKQQLDRLEKMATAALADQPELKDRFKRTTIEGHSYLTLSLDSKMLPWDKAPLDENAKCGA